MVSLLLAVLVSFVSLLIPSAFLASSFAVSLQLYDITVSWLPLFLLDQPVSFNSAVSSI